MGWESTVHLCCSRANMLSGKSLFPCFKINWKSGNPCYVLLGSRLWTFGTGKWHNEKIWSKVSKGKNVFLAELADLSVIAVRDLQAMGSFPKPVKKGYSTDLIRWLSTKIFELITRSPATRQNAHFFCICLITVPHDPYSPKLRLHQSYDTAKNLLPENFMGLHAFWIWLNWMVRDENLTRIG